MSSAAPHPMNSTAAKGLLTIQNELVVGLGDLPGMRAADEKVLCSMTSLSVRNCCPVICPSNPSVSTTTCDAGPAFMPIVFACTAEQSVNTKYPTKKRRSAAPIRWLMSHGAGQDHTAPCIGLDIGVATCRVYAGIIGCLSKRP